MKTILWQVILISGLILLGNAAVWANDNENNIAGSGNTNRDEPNFPDTTPPASSGGTVTSGGGTSSGSANGSSDSSDGAASDASDSDSSASNTPAVGNGNNNSGQNPDNAASDSSDSEPSSDNANNDSQQDSDSAASDSSDNAQASDDEQSSNGSTQGANTGSQSNNNTVQLNQANNTAKTAPQTAVMIDLELTDEEVDNYSLPPEPEPFTNGEVVDNYDGTVTYTPEADFFGTDTFTYTVIDANTKISDKRVVKVEVSNEVDAGGPASCQVYAVHDEENSDSQFLTIDTYGGGYKTMPLGPLHVGFDIEGIAIHPETHVLYAVSGWDHTYASQRTYGTLFRVNSHTGKLVTVGVTDFKDITALAFNPEDQTLWAVAGYFREPRGIIKIKNLNTAASKMVYQFDDDEEMIEGLAWNQQGTLLYGSRGKSLVAYAYKNNKLESRGVVCPNMLQGTADENNAEVEVEALETMLTPNRLMLSINRQVSTDLYEFDVNNCQIVPDRSFNFATQFPDVESIAWPLECQPKPEVESLKIKFAGKQQALICLKKPRRFSVKGKVLLEPSKSEVYVQTGWEVVAPKTIDCPAGEVCKKGKHDQQLLSDGDEFEIQGWWPGLSTDDESEVARVQFNIGIQDTKGNVLSYYGEVSKTLLGSIERCEAAEAERAAAQQAEETDAESDTDADKDRDDKETGADAEASDDLTSKQAYLRDYLINEQGATSVEFDGNNLYALIGQQLHHGILSSLSDANKAFSSLRLIARNKGQPDDNGYVNFTVIYPSGSDDPSERDLLLYQGALTLDEEQVAEINEAEEAAESSHPAVDLIKEAQRLDAFKTFLQQQLNASSVTIEGKNVYALLGNELHHAKLGRMLDPAEELPSALILLPRGKHFEIVYPDGQKQLLLYQGLVVIEDEKETDVSENTEEIPTESDSGSNNEDTAETTPEVTEEVTEDAVQENEVADSNASTETDAVDEATDTTDDNAADNVDSSTSDAADFVNDSNSTEPVEAVTDSTETQTTSDGSSTSETASNDEVAESESSASPPEDTAASAPPAANETVDAPAAAEPPAPVASSNNSSSESAAQPPVAPVEELATITEEDT